MGSERARQYHSIILGEKNTWDDWHLIPNTRPLVNPPSLNEKYVDIPGMNGQYDLTEALLGYPTYGSRTGSWEFIVANDYWDWATAYSTIMHYLHGKRLRCILEDDRDHYYMGRFKVNQWKSDKNWSNITIDYTIEPFKHSLSGSSDKWLWDPFNFQTGIIRNYTDLTVDGTRELIIVGGDDHTIPAFTLKELTSEDFTIGYFGRDRETRLTKVLTSENIDIPVRPDDMVIEYGENTITFTGTGTIDVDYREGIL